jgi:ferritin
MDKKLQQAFHEQIKNEFASGYLYLSMAAHFEAQNLAGFAHWMRVQAKEEQGHAMKMFDFLNDRGVRVILKEIPQPQVDFSSASEIFQETLKHEKKVTELINKLYELAQKVNDYPSMVLLQWFINEQVEEESNPTKILMDLEMIKEQGPALIMLDRELAKREG